MACPPSFTAPLALAATIAATATAFPQAPTLAVIRVTVVDVAGGRVLPNRTVTIAGDTIAAVGESGSPPRGARVIDGRGKFLIPGLWDMHAHNQGSGEESLDLYLANGVVGARDMGSDLDFIVPLRDRIRRGERRGPELVIAGPMLDNAPPEWPFRRRVTGADDAREAVAALAARGVDFVKVHTNTPREAFFAIAEQARAGGLPFAGHIPARVTVEEAATSGIRSIEHLAEFRLFRECTGQPAAYERDRCRPLFETLFARRIWQTPTINFFRVLTDAASGKPLPHADYASDASLDLMRRNLGASKLNEQAVTYLRGLGTQSLAVIRDMLAMGNLFLAGCDGGVPGFCLHDELEALIDAGLSPHQALQTATLNPARFLGREATEGTVAAGKRANLVLLDANPLDDVRNSRRIAAVVTRGTLLSKADIDRLLTARRRTAR